MGQRGSQLSHGVHPADMCKIGPRLTERFFGLLSRGDVHDGANDLSEFARPIQYGASDRAKGLYPSGGKNDSKFTLRIYPLLLSGLHFRSPLDPRSIFGVNPFEKMRPSGLHFRGIILINVKDLL